MSDRIDCFLRDQCPVADAGCVWCFARWLDVLPLLPGGVPRQSDLQQMVTGESDACVHRGSKRRCCDQLWICRKHSCDCTPTESESIHPQVLRCSACSDFQFAEVPTI